MDNNRDLLFALYEFFKAQQVVSESVNKVLANLPHPQSFSGILDIDSDPLWPSWRHEYSKEEIERLNRNYENHCASGL